MKGDTICKIREGMRAERACMEGHWDELYRLFMPFRIDGTGMPDIPSADALHDSTPRHAPLIMANGLASLITPREEIWMEFAPPRELRKQDDVVRWYRECSEVAVEFLEASNFYEEMQEAYIDSPVFGTAALYCGELDDSEFGFGDLHFRRLPIGTYYISENAKGRVTCVIRDLSYTAEQAAEEYGEENLPREIRKKLKTPQGKTERFAFYQYVARRKGEAEPDAADKDKLPWESIVVSEKGKHVVKTEGYHEFPFAVHRYRKFGECVWGFGPGFIAKGDSRQLSFLNDLADVGTEKAIFPPIKAHGSLEGEIGQGPLEITYFDDSDPSKGAGLDTWGAPAYQALAAAKERIDDKRAMIREAFYVDMFKLFSTRAMEKQPLSATEAQLIAGEKLTQFSPVFGRIVSEFLDIILARVFGVLYRAGKFPAPPQAIIDLKGIPAPSVQYKNRIMLALAAQRNGSLVEFFNFAAPIVQADPTALDAVNPMVMIKDAARNAGLPEAWLATPEEMKARADARAQAAQQQMQMQMAEQASKVAANASKIPAEERQQMMQQGQQQQG